MEAYFTLVLIVAIILILAVVIYSTRKVSRLDRTNMPGLFKPAGIIRGAQYALLIVFGVTAYLLTKRLIGFNLGYGLMGASFALWVPFQFWQSARLLLDDTKAAYFDPRGRVTEVPWAEVREVRFLTGGIELHSGKGVLRVPRWMADPDRIRSAIEKNVPAQRG